MFSLKPPDYQQVPTIRQKPRENLRKRSKLNPQASTVVLPEQVCKMLNQLILKSQPGLAM